MRPARPRGRNGGRNAATPAEDPAWLPTMIARRGAGRPGGRAANCRSFCRRFCRFFLVMAPAVVQTGPQDTASSTSVVTRPRGRRAPLPAIRLARRPAVRPNGLAARAGLVLLAALASLLVAGRLQVPPAVRTSAVGRVPTAVGVDARAGRVFITNSADGSVSVLDAHSGHVLHTTSVGQSPLAVAVVASRQHV